MRLLSLFAIVGFAAAESIYERQVETINTVIGAITRDTAALNTALQQFNGPADTQNLLAAHTRLTQTVMQGAQQVSQASSISLTDAAQLQSSVSQLTTTVQTTVSNAAAKKQLIIQSGAGPQVAQGLQQQLQGAQQLSAAIVSKVPQSAQGPAQQLSAGVASALNTGVMAFSDQLTGATNVMGGFATATAGMGNPAFFTGAAVPRAAAG